MNDPKDPNRHRERRTFPRVPTSISATIAGPRGRFAVRVIDVSLGGMSLDARAIDPSASTLPGASAVVLFDGAMTSVEFETDTGARVHLFARVRWTADDRRSFGVQFLDVPARERDALIAFIDHLLRNADTKPTPEPG